MRRGSIFPWGTRVRIGFTREKITLPTPSAAATILAWLQTKSLRAAKNERNAVQFYRGEKQAFFGLFHNQGMSFIGMSNAFPQRAAT